MRLRSIHLSPRAALGLFIGLLVFMFAQAVWWVIYIAQLTDEKVEIAEELGASSAYVERLNDQERARQIMVGSEGVVFLIVMGVGLGLIYRSLRQSQKLKHQQQNFLLAVTHELRTPISSLRLYLESLASPKIPEAKKATIGPKVMASLTRLERLVDDVLDAGRLERNAFTLERHRMSLSDLVREVAEEARLIPTRYDVAIESEIEDDLVVDGDYRALRRAITGLVDNAFKYHGDDQLQLLIHLHARDSIAILLIADNGIGFEPNEAEALFDRFYRGGDEMTRRADGSGLGLYMARSIARAHGGDVVAESAGRDRGADFTMTVPLVREAILTQ